jgi:hypothetical protein
VGDWAGGCHCDLIIFPVCFLGDDRNFVGLALLLVRICVSEDIVLVFVSEVVVKPEAFVCGGDLGEGQGEWGCFHHIVIIEHEGSSRFWDYVSLDHLGSSILSPSQEIDMDHRKDPCACASPAEVS